MEGGENGRLGWLTNRLANPAAAILFPQPRLEEGAQLMLSVNVKADISQALRKIAASKEDVAKAVPRALNKTATTVRAEAARKIVSVGYGIKINAIKRSLSIRRATQAQRVAIVKATGRPIPLINYGARQTKPGVSVAVLHGRKTVRHAFIATMHSGHKGVFIRADVNAAAANAKGFKIHRQRAAGVSRHGLPIDELFGPGVPSAFANQAVQTAIAQVARERFGVVLNQELRYITRR